MGPVWAYWAFPMERYCGDIGRNIKSRRFPYAAINKYITSQAQLTHVTLLYGLHDQLSLRPPRSDDKDLQLPLCELKPFLIIYIYINIDNINLVTNFCIRNLDPLYVLNSPMAKSLVKTLSKPLWNTLTAALATRFETSVSVIRKLIPSQSPFDQYGRARQVDGGDIIHARELISLQTDSRDMSFVRVSICMIYIYSITSATD
jgi:hypothetical protein